MTHVTINFKPVTNGMSPSQIIKQYKENDSVIVKDKRNNIICINPTYDLQCYLNYVNFLNSLYSEWKSYGYLDLGLVPILICPSFMSDAMNEQTGILSEAWKLQIIPMKPVSFLCNSYQGATKDVWIRKDLLAKWMGVPIDKATLSNYLNILNGGTIK